ncbi:phage major capsid protein [Turicibacter sanguinis]|uniref:phage major capsid protein n=1 Tax=Turicibacter sanguinis TaxID=154288 RepID=UPI0012BC044D|nr:phage major capsid protein [Turicibacter sanguinis]MDB8566260.1 phage major capsid protein [Turicibacter sanguinis]MDB8568876.1 phage major capsid protein [Turicibacter sanguinis]MDB8571761.1 phage major capsid protein [Turicibacter sanguinis]MDB8580384.1 phage major capsid protein [Turicibacter sanguinis]MTO10650.1 phage major capsid protein [Turicibacter sanguinis]
MTKNELIEKMLQMNDLCITENRSFTEQEEELYYSLEQQLKRLDRELLRRSCNVESDNRKEDDVKMENNNLKEAILEKRNLGDIEVRANHIGGMSEGVSLAPVQKTTLAQEIVRKLGEDGVLTQFLKFVPQKGHLKIPVCGNKSKVAMVSEGEVFPEKDLNLSYVDSDLVKLAQMSIMTNELVEDTDLAIQGFIIEETVRDFVRTIEHLALNGNIEGKVEGVAVTDKAKVVTTSALTLDTVKEAYYQMPVATRTADDLLFVTTTDVVRGLDMLTSGDGQFLLNSPVQAQMNERKYFDHLYNARVVEVEANELPEGVLGVFVCPSHALHVGMGRDFKISADPQKRSEYDEVCILASMRLSIIVKNGDAIVQIKAEQ